MVQYEMKFDMSTEIKRQKIAKKSKKQIWSYNSSNSINFPP